MSSAALRLSDILIVIIVCLFCVLLLSLVNRGRSCVVVVTGESVRLIDCTFDENFIAYAQTLKPYNFNDKI